MLRAVLFFLCYGTALVASDHKMIYLISTPRSLSTAFVRMMDHRGDFSVYNEIANGVYDHMRFGKQAEQWFYDHTPKTFQEANEVLLADLEHANVFVKEVSFTVHPFQQEVRELIHHPQVHFLFMVRDPHAVAISYHRKIEGIDDHIADLIAHNQLYDLFQLVKAESPNPVKLIFTEELAADPKRVVEAFCEQYEIPFSEEHLQWEPYGPEFTGWPQWHEIKSYDFFRLWHSDAANSSGFALLHSYEKDAEGNPTFSEVEDLEKREKLIADYLENVEAYRKLCSEKEPYLLYTPFE